jgi:hypothetical protein
MEVSTGSNGGTLYTGSDIGAGLAEAGSLSSGGDDGGKGACNTCGVGPQPNVPVVKGLLGPEVNIVGQKDAKPNGNQ